MEKLIAYIQTGAGRGLKYIFVGALLICLILGILIYMSLPDINKNPDIQSFANQFPAVQLENGVIMQPQNVNITHVIPNSGGVPVTLNTTVQTVDALDVPVTLYITSSQAYIKFFEQLQTLPLAAFGNATITPQDVLNKIQESFIVAVGILGLFLLGLIWVGYLFLYLFGTLFFWVVGLSTDSKMIGRASSVMWLGILVLDLILFSVGYGFHIVTAWACALMLVTFTVFKVRKMTASDDALTTETVQDILNTPARSVTPPAEKKSVKKKIKSKKKSSK